MATKREQRLKKQSELKKTRDVSEPREAYKIPEAQTDWKKYAFWGVGGVLTAALLIFFFYKAGTPTDSGPVSGNVKVGQTVDGIPCGAMEVTTYHVHAHLTVYINGSQSTIPAGVGIADPAVDARGFVGSGTCFMWLHTHDNTGIIHIEAPSEQTFTLSQFFDIWGKTLSSTQLEDTKGSVTAYVDGKKVNGNPGDIKLVNHESIVLMVGKSVSVPDNYNFAASGL